MGSSPASSREQTTACRARSSRSGLLTRTPQPDGLRAVRSAWRYGPQQAPPLAQGRGPGPETFTRTVEVNARGGLEVLALSRTSYKVL